MASLFLTTLLLLFLNKEVAGQNRLILNNDCPCPGHNVTFECTVTGGGTTVWQGSGVFDCPNHSDEIVLRHINFGSSVSGECNDGAIIGESLGFNENSYTSQLSILYKDEFAGRNVTCIHDNGITFISLLSLTIVHNNIVSFPYPSNVHLIAAAPQQLTFSWNPVAPNCAAIHYNILAQNCGNCPSSTPHTTVVCHDMNVGDNLTCSFVVQNVRTCDDITGNMSDPVKVHLKVPSAPAIEVIPHYLYPNKELIAFTTKFNKLESLKISEGFNGSVLSYLITYNDSFSGKTCGSDTLPASSCLEGTCTKVSQLSSLTCTPLPRSINVTVAGVGVFGKGMDSYPSTTSIAVNRFVEVEIIQTSYRVICTFINQRNTTQKTCTITYGPAVDGNCRTSKQTSRTVSENFVTVGLPLEEIKQEYCFSVTASNGSFTAIVEGKFKASQKDLNITTDVIRDSSKTCELALTISATTLTFLNLSTIIILIIVIFILVMSKRRASLELEKAQRIQAHGLYEEITTPTSMDQPTLIRNTSYMDTTELQRNSSQVTFCN